VLIVPLMSAEDLRKSVMFKQCSRIELIMHYPLKLLMKTIARKSQ